MRVASAFSTIRDARKAASDAYQKLIVELRAAPNFLVLASTISYDVNEVGSTLGALVPQAAIHGSTSSRAVMTETGLHSEEGRGLSLFGISDTQGAYGTGHALLWDDPAAAGKNAVIQALENAGRSGELPQLVWLTTAPGQEEAVIAGIEQLLGNNIPIVGGSSADDYITGDWMQIANGQSFENAVVASVLFPSTKTMFAFHGGYEPTEFRGRVTSARGRVLRTIDNRPAVEVYEQWTGADLSKEGSGQDNFSIISETTLKPFGRRVENPQGGLDFLLSHPRAIGKEGAIELFGEIEIGDELILMRGTLEGMVRRAGRVALSAMDLHGANIDKVAGGLIIFCAGSMHTIGERGGEIVDSIGSVLQDKPFMGTFTFGEQGCFHGGQNRHGNLMISVLLFGADPPSMNPLDFELE